MKLSAIILCLLVMSPVSPAYAEENAKKKVPATICYNPEELASRLKSCANNSLFVEATRDCLGRLEQQRKSAASELSRNASEQSRGSQQENFSAGKEGYAEALASHEYQLKLSELAQYEINGYFDYLEFPDDWSNDEVIMQEACYSENYREMDSLLSKLEDEIDELDEKIEKDKSLLASTSGRLQQIGADSAHSMKKIKGGKSERLPSSGEKGAKAGGKHPKRASDITGSEKAMKDAKKGASEIQQK